MKAVFINLALFVVFAIAFSSLEGCSLSTSSKTTVPNSSNTGTAGANKTGSTGDSTYPPLASAIADADMEFAPGRTEKISQRKGKVVLVNLWAVWCGPCRAEMPDIVALQDKYRDKGFQVIGLNVGKDDEGHAETFEEMKTFGEKMKLNYELARAPNEMTNQIYKFSGMNGIPISLLVDRDGHLRAVLRGGGPGVVKQMQESVDRAMAE